MIRGVRNSRDFDEEMVLSTVNSNLCSSIQTIFLPTHSKDISSSVIRELVKYKVGVSELIVYTPHYIANKLVEKFYD